jgi:hypothetical protein
MTKEPLKLYNNVSRQRLYVFLFVFWKFNWIQNFANESITLTPNNDFEEYSR